MKVKEIMTEPVIVANETNTLEEIAQLMLDNRIGCLPIIGNEGRIVGIVTDTDFMAKEHAIPFSRYYAPQLFGKWMGKEGIEESYKAACSLEVKEIMSSPVVSVTEEDGVEVLIEKMIHHDLNHVPVVRDGEPVGIVSRHDLLKLLFRDNKRK
ncbi:CBS domain-containing protein [Desulfobacterota bacterium AH_259_B03_O07]|nr:CBS domain-containing protein [Desulfobacterota bacterium AH_259_B03_O07]